MTQTDSKFADSDQSSCNQPSASGVLQDVHIEHGTYYVTTLIIPKQESTSSSCEALKEEEFFAIQNERSLFPVGWIHTHPSQSCFMSSIDLHTHFSYQAMVPEAFAIVMAPTDQSRCVIHSLHYMISLCHYSGPFLLSYSF
uniref:MPN domain-containing protein n=1 Tax=Populus trichocarpa TaxID=3694 RepID=A0A3N7FMP8_POPTR